MTRRNINVYIVIKMQISTHETGRVVVTDGLGVTVRLEGGVRLDDLVLEAYFFLLII